MKDPGFDLPIAAPVFGATAAVTLVCLIAVILTASSLNQFVGRVSPDTTGKGRDRAPQCVPAIHPDDYELCNQVYGDKK